MLMQRWPARPWFMDGGVGNFGWMAVVSPVSVFGVDVGCGCGSVWFGW